MTKEQRLIQIIAAQREQANNQTANIAAAFDEMKVQFDAAMGQLTTLKSEFDETKLQRDSAFVFLQTCFQSGRLPVEGVAAIAGLNAWIETNKALKDVPPLHAVK